MSPVRRSTERQVLVLGALALHRQRTCPGLLRIVRRYRIQTITHEQAPDFSWPFSCCTRASTRGVPLLPLPPSLAGSLVEVVFQLNLSNILHVSNTHLLSGKLAEVTIGPD